MRSRAAIDAERKSSTKDVLAPSLWRSAVLVGVLWFLGGLVGLLIGTVIALFLASSPRRELMRERMPLAAAVLLLAAMGTVLLAGLPSASGIGPMFVRHRLDAHYLAGAALALLVMGILQSDRVYLPTRPVPVLEPPVRQPSRPWRRRPSGLAFGVTVLSIAALAVRFLAVRGAVADPVSARIAQNLMLGRGFSIGHSGAFPPTGLRMPVVPALLAVAQTTQSPGTFARLIWAVLGTAIVPLTAAATVRLFDRRTGLVAAGLVALLPTFWLQSERLDSVTLAAFLVALLLLFASYAMEATWLTAMLVGSTVGVLGLTRPEGLLVGTALVAGMMSMVSPRAGRAAWPPRVIVASLVPIVLIVGSWLARNESALHTVSPTTEAGPILAGANDSTTYGGELIGSWDPVVGERYVDGVLADPAAERRLTVAARARAASFLGNHLATTPVVAGVRLLRAFQLWDPGNERAAHAARGVRVDGWFAQWVSFLLLLLASAMGFRRLRRRRSDRLSLLAPPLLAVALVAVISYGEPTMRAAIDPVLAVAAAVGLSALIPGPRAAGLPDESTWRNDEGSRRHGGRGRSR